MSTKSNYSLIRGKKFRITRLNGCGIPVWGTDASAVSSGFVSIAFTANTTDAETIDIINANGKTCATDTTSPTFNSYGVEITFCGVQPCVFEMLTGQKPVLDYYGDATGFRMNSKVDQSAQAFALEVWAGVPGVACAADGGGGGSYGYVLLPFVGSGVVGDFTIENAAANFVVTGATTKDGNAWGAGPYEVVPNLSGDPDRLPTLIDTNDHLLVQWTSVAPPDDTEGCVLLEEPDDIVITGVVAGTPGHFVPSNAPLPENLAALKSHATIGDSVHTGTAWTVGQHVILGDASSANWSGTAWAAGAAALTAASKATAAKPAKD